MNKNIKEMKLKQATHCSKKVGDVVPGAVLYLSSDGYCSEILAA